MPGPNNMYPDDGGLKQPVRAYKDTWSIGKLFNQLLANMRPPLGILEELNRKDYDGR